MLAYKINKFFGRSHEKDTRIDRILLKQMFAHATKCLFQLQLQIEEFFLKLLDKIIYPEIQKSLDSADPINLARLQEAMGKFFGVWPREDCILKRVLRQIKVQKLKLSKLLRVILLNL